MAPGVSSSQKHSLVEVLVTDRHALVEMWLTDYSVTTHSKHPISYSDLAMALSTVGLGYSLLAMTIHG